MIKILWENKKKIWFQLYARACAHMNATLLEQKCDFQSPIAETRIPQKLLAFRAYKNNSAVEGLVRHKPSCYERF